VKQRAEQLRAQILSWYDDKPAEESFVLEGQKHCVMLSPRGNRRRIKSMQKLFERLGMKLFLKLSKFTLKEFDDHIPEPERAKFVVSEQIGPRELKCVAKAIEKAA